MDARPLVVVVDDNMHFVTYLSILLKRMNLEVLAVDNAAEAIEISRVTRPHLVTMEMALSDMDGLQALRVIREDQELADLPVIMISSDLDKNKQWEALSLGCIDVLDKPVDLRRLHKSIQRCDLYPGGRRRYLRSSFERVVDLHYQGKSLQVSSVTLSERGIFVHSSVPLPKGAHVDIDLPLSSGELFKAGGSVIYAEAQKSDSPSPASGVAIKFDRMTLKESERLTSLVEELLIGDILEEQTEPVVRPG